MKMRRRRNRGTDAGSRRTRSLTGDRRIRCCCFRNQSCLLIRSHCCCFHNRCCFRSRSQCSLLSRCSRNRCSRIRCFHSPVATVVRSWDHKWLQSIRRRLLLRCCCSRSHSILILIRCSSHSHRYCRSIPVDSVSRCIRRSRCCCCRFPAAAVGSRRRRRRHLPDSRSSWVGCSSCFLVHCSLPDRCSRTRCRCCCHIRHHCHYFRRIPVVGSGRQCWRGWLFRSGVAGRASDPPRDPVAAAQPAARTRPSGRPPRGSKSQTGSREEWSGCPCRRR